MTKKNPGGRPALPAEDRMTTRTFRSTDEQAAKLDALGGSAWLREQIDAAPWPRGTKPKK